MLAVAVAIDRLNTLIGRGIAWAMPLMVVIQVTVVLMRYVFGLGSIWMQESIVYLHASTFLLAGAYTLAVDAHVRVDILYRDARPRTRALVDTLGMIFFLLPMCGVILWVSTPYVARSWSILEGSRETSGIQAIFLLKTLILVFAGLMALQGIGIVFKVVLALAGSSIVLRRFTREVGVDGEKVA
ncbi:TRAP transporter small permease subunit [Breoghania sp.]|uniref:TRAP transporter small permease subunit n=1 Tax=Breoghania sp. TaxID=2065378 RepID=UPI00262ED13A|nr:TRAP transporter small permease subunit [Breoghania sp.]MDJ0932493.1 TRAP transporter small permease subunit [Breoghania sp.]